MREGESKPNSILPTALKEINTEAKDLVQCAKGGMRGKEGKKGPRDYSSGRYRPAGGVLGSGQNIKRVRHWVNGIKGRE